MRGELPPFQDEEEVFEAEYARGSLWARKNYQRALIAFAGPLANFIFALILMAGVYFFVGKDVANPEIGAIEIGAGADRSGLKLGDQLIDIDGHPVSDEFSEIIKQTQEGGDPLSVVVRRNGDLLPFQISLSDLKEEDDFGDKTSRKVMGIVMGSGAWDLEAIYSVDGIPTQGNADQTRALLLSRLGQDVTVLFGHIKNEGDVQKLYRIHVSKALNEGLGDSEHIHYHSVRYGVKDSIVHKPLSFLSAWTESFIFFGKIIRKTSGVLYQMVVGKKDSGDLGGVVKIGEMTGENARQADRLGYSVLFKILVILSVNIGFLNLLPLPMLDGGHLSFNLYEAICGKAPSAKVRAYMMAASVGIVLSFVILINIRDIFEIFS